MSGYWMGKITKRLGLSRSSGSLDGSNGYDGFLLAIDNFTSSPSVSCSIFPLSMSLSFGNFVGTMWFSVSALRGLCELKIEIPSLRFFYFPTLWKFEKNFSSPKQRKFVNKWKSSVKFKFFRLGSDRWNPKTPKCSKSSDWPWKSSNKKKITLK